MYLAMKTLRERIRAELESNSVAIIPFTILGFPNVELSIKAVKILQDSQVAAFETAIPVKKGFSFETNLTIRNACKIALKERITPERVINFYETYRPNIYIIYKGAFGMPLDMALKKFHQKIDMVLPEWEVKNPQLMAKLCEKSQVALVDAISPLMEWKEIKRRVISSQGIVYLSCALKTGGLLFPINTIRLTISRIKKLRPDIYVCCGFGIKTPNDVRTIGSIQGCDAVIIGTALLESLSCGLEPFSKFLQKIIWASKNLKMLRV